MILWTIQSEAAVKRFMRTGMLRADGRHVFEHFRPAYQWMSRQMTERLGPPPPGIRYPIWAWKIWTARSPRPDLRSKGHLPAGTKGARIEFEVPDDRALLSDFSRWHCVFAGEFLADNKLEHTRVEALRWSAKRNEESWSRIFELDGGDPAYIGKPSERSIQAALWYVELAEVRRITWYTSR